MRAALVLSIALSGCSSLPQCVMMTDQERAICAAEGCTVWSKQELDRLVGIALQRGYVEGKKANGQKL